ncbi:MAG: type VI secretion protein IcmF/TssM N-terminal domain-containing protein [Candidatus Desantisbacteria bacterium]
MQGIFSFITRFPFLSKLIPGFAVLIIIVSFIYMRFGVRIGNVVLIGVIIIACLLLCVNLIVKLWQKKKEDSFGKGLQENSEKQKISKVEVQRALSEISRQWVAAVGELKKAGMTLYSLPWYILIGEPQSGKSTTLKYSGLEFPVGTEARSGTGGTRNCDWWFTNDAVILDTAGRFTFQEENAPDQDEWKSFLNLLKKHRANCPINGIIMVIPVTSLLEDSMEIREEKAKNIRQKLFYMQEMLEVRVPVFLLLTKADHTLGFTEFFSRLSATQQRQMFGWSNQTPVEQSYNPEGFSEVFKKLCNAMHQWRLKFIGEEINPQLIDKLFVFPEEFQALEKPFQDYLNVIFSQDRFHEPLFFRGFYFTSGLQQGVPVAQACRQFLGGEDGNARTIEKLESTFATQRAFFIKDFYGKKVFPEQGLIVRSTKSQKRDSIIQTLMWTGGAIIATISLLLLIWGVSAFKRDISPAFNIVTKAKELLQARVSPSLIDTFKVSQSLSQQRKRIKDSNISAIFFKGKENTVTDDLKQVHYQVFMNKCLHPLVKATEERLVTINWDSFPNADFEKFIDALQEYILWSSIAESPEKKGKDNFSQLSVLPFVEFSQVTAKMMLGTSYSSERVDEWLNDKAFSKDKVEEEFKYFVKDEKGNPTKTLSKHARGEVIEPALENLENYWELKRLEGTGWWFTLIDIAKNTNEAYQGILTLELKEDREEIQDFMEKCTIFNPGIDKIAEHLKQDVPGYQKNVDFAFRKICQKCNQLYEGLIPFGISDPIIEDIITRQKERVMVRIKDEYNIFIQQSIYEYPHIITIPEQEKGTTSKSKLIASLTLSKEAKTINDLLKNTCNFANIYCEEEENEFQQKLKELKDNIECNPKDAQKYMYQWHIEQTAARDDIIKELDGLKDIEFHEQWNIREMESVIKRILFLALQERESMGIAICGGNLPATGLSKKGGKGGGGGEPDHTFISFRKKTLEQNATLNVFQSNPKAYERLLNESLRDVYSYLAYWYNIYQKFEPGKELAMSNDWRSFQRKIASMKKPLLDLDDDPMRGLFENVPYQEMKNLITEIPRAATDPDIKSAFSKLENITKAYQRGEISSLALACDEFTDYVSSLGQSPLHAWEKVSKDKERGFTAISRFKNAHKGIGNELLIQRLEDIEKKASALLKKGLKSDIVGQREVPKGMNASGVPIKFTIEFCSSAVLEMNPDSAIKYLQEYTNYWVNVYNGFIPGGKANQAKDWKEFQHQIAIMKTPLADLTDSLAGLLLKNMDYKEMQVVIDSIPGAKADADINSNLKRLEKIVAGYHSKNVVVGIEEAGNRFVSCISNLDSLPLTAWNQLANGEVDVGEIKTFSTFKKQNKGLEGELFIERLKDLENKAISLLREDVKDMFVSEWDELMQEYYGRLNNKFPFKAFASTPGEFKFEMPCVKFNDLREFLLSSKGIERVINKFSLSKVLSDSGENLGFPGEERHKKIIIHCLELKNFLFDQEEVRNHPIELWFSSKINKPNSCLIGQRFTLCRLLAPGGIRLTLRESSQSKQQMWKPDAEGERLIIEGINEQTGQKEQMEICGDSLIFLAYVINMGSPQKASGEKRWIIPIELPDPEKKGSSVWGRFDVKFTMRVPKMPIL